MKQDVRSILLANWYFTQCVIDNSDDDKKDIARKYLLVKIKSALLKRSKLSNSSDELIFF